MCIILNGKGSLNWFWSICVYSVELCRVPHHSAKQQTNKKLTDNNLKRVCIRLACPKWTETWLDPSLPQTLDDPLPQTLDDPLPQPLDDPLPFKIIYIIIVLTLVFIQWNLITMKVVLREFTVILKKKLYPCLGFIVNYEQLVYPHLDSIVNYEQLVYLV